MHLAAHLTAMYPEAQLAHELEHDLKQLDGY